jgi:membrane protein DedA with SNARE-associated domain/membrane-associated phospholipid phosphatase
MGTIQSYLEYFGSDPTWAVFLIFFIALGEALLIIGLFVPSTVVLVGAGALVGAGHLPFWPVFLATAIGALAGDQISYWVGRHYGERLKTLWPLRNYPQLMASGEDFIRNHGGKSIAIGRFVPGVKAVVAGIAGMLGMNQMYFSAVNAVSSFIWAAAHIFPGILLGQGLAFAGELSGRLFIVLIELLVVLAIAAWAIRITAAFLSPYLAHVLIRLSQWTRARRSKSMRRFSRAISPQNPRSVIIVFFMAVLMLGLIMIATLAVSLVARNALPNVDISTMNFMREIRNSPADALMIPIAMLGDGIVLLPMMVVLLLWLTWKRAHRAAAALLIAFGLAGILGFVLAASHENTANALDPLTFASGHIARITTAYGLLAVLVSHAMGRWGKALVYSVMSLVIVAIAYARMYLGAETVTGMLGGLLFGAVIIAAFGVAIEAMPLRRLRPWGLLASCLFVWGIASYIHTNRHLETAEKLYSARLPIYSMTEKEWLQGGWARLPQRRIDLAGKTEEHFNFQWAGAAGGLKTRLTGSDWKEWPKWSWRDSLRYLDLRAPLAEMAPRPGLHEGLTAQLTMTRAVQGNSEARLALRIYKTAAMVKTANAPQPIVLISLTRETLVRRLYTYAIPETSPPTPEDLAALQATLRTSGIVSTNVTPELSVLRLP